MVFLKDISFQWPWHPNAPEVLSDKEIYTHRISLEDATNRWRVPLLPPMNGYAYTGFRMVVFGRDEPYTSQARLVMGETDRDMFGVPWDQTVATSAKWTPLGFPLTHKMIAIGEDGLDLLLTHSEECSGHVEFIAQRFDDLLEDEREISYVFLNHRTDKVEWILNKDNLMYRPNANDGPVYRRKSKIIPSMLRLLDINRNQWQDTTLIQGEVNVSVPLLV